MRTAMTEKHLGVDLRDLLRIDAVKIKRPVWREETDDEVGYWDAVDAYMTMPSMTQFAAMLAKEVADSDCRLTILIPVVKAGEEYDLYLPCAASDTFDVWQRHWQTLLFEDKGVWYETAINGYPKDVLRPLFSPEVQALLERATLAPFVVDVKKHQASWLDDTVPVLPEVIVSSHDYYQLVSPERIKLVSRPGRLDQQALSRLLASIDSDTNSAFYHFVMPREYLVNAALAKPAVYAVIKSSLKMVFERTTNCCLDIGTDPKVYEIVKRDLLEELKQQAEQLMMTFGVAAKIQEKIREQLMLLHKQNIYLDWSQSFVYVCKVQGVNLTAEQVQQCERGFVGLSSPLFSDVEKHKLARELLQKRLRHLKITRQINMSEYFHLNNALTRMRLWQPATDIAVMRAWIAKYELKPAIVDDLVHIVASTQGFINTEYKRDRLLRAGVAEHEVAYVDANDAVASGDAALPFHHQHRLSNDRSVLQSELATRPLAPVVDTASVTAGDDADEIFAGAGIGSDEGEAASSGGESPRSQASSVGSEMSTPAVDVGKTPSSPASVAKPIACGTPSSPLTLAPPPAATRRRLSRLDRIRLMRQPRAEVPEVSSASVINVYVDAGAEGSNSIVDKPEHKGKKQSVKPKSKSRSSRRFFGRRLKNKSLDASTSRDAPPAHLRMR